MNGSINDKGLIIEWVDFHSRREPQRREYRGQLGKQGGRAARTEYGPGCAGSKSRPRFRTLAALHEHEADDHERQQDVHRQK